MSVIILFGLPGTGKTYVGKVFEKYFGYYFYDGDYDLTPEMKQAIKTKTVFTDQMRDVYFEKLISRIQDLSSSIKNLVGSRRSLASARPTSVASGHSPIYRAGAWAH